MTALLIALGVLAYFVGFIVTALRWSRRAPFATPIPALWPLAIAALVIASPWLACGWIVKQVRA